MHIIDTYLFSNGEWIVMTFQQLNYLVEISKCGSINKAAQKLFLSQSGISIAIKELEEELNITFFIRTNKGVTFTPEGREFLSHVVSLLDSKKRIELMHSTRSGHTTSTYFSVATQRYPFTQDAFMKFTNLHRDETYRLQFIETGIESVIEDVSNRSADVGVVSESELTEKIIGKLLDSREIEFHELFTVKPCVYVKKDHPLASKDSVTENDLKDYPYITFEQTEGVAIDFSEECQLFTTETPARRIIINTREAAVDLVSVSDAVTTGSGLLVKGISPDGIKSVVIDGQPDIKIGYVVPKDTALSPLTEEFVNILTDSIRESIAYTESLRNA